MAAVASFLIAAVVPVRSRFTLLAGAALLRFDDNAGRSAAAHDTRAKSCAAARPQRNVCPLKAVVVGFVVGVVAAGHADAQTP